MAPHNLNFITGNANKLAEVQAILKGVIELKSQSLDLPEIQGTIEEVSKTKCKTAAELVRGILNCNITTELTQDRSKGLFLQKIHACASTPWASYQGHICMISSSQPVPNWRN